MSAYSQYRKGLIARFWAYAQSQPPLMGLLEIDVPSVSRPPVFSRSNRDSNVIIDPASSKGSLVLKEIASDQRHKWFGSMSSSQALAQSVFGNLKVHDELGCLNDFAADDGTMLFAPATLTKESISLEYTVTSLREPRPTSVDVLVDGEYRVAIECKLTESDVGRCSRPGLGPKDSNYGTSHCDGSYTHQRGRQSRCSLTEAKVEYWRHIPNLFGWDSGIDHLTCPLRPGYQLVRNVLAAVVKTEGKCDPNSGHAVVIYDERNPAFRVGGAATKSFDDTRSGMLYPLLLRRCSWQRLITRLRATDTLPWLTDELREKYGF